MGLAVIRPGLFSTIQDRGREGYRAFGVAAGGAFDRASADLANALLGNPPDAAVVELTLHGGEFEATEPLALALAGAPLAAKVLRGDGRDLVLNPPVAFPLARGDRLSLGGMARGARAYLAALGGWLTPLVLGSRSSEAPIRAGEVLPCRSGSRPIRHLEPPQWPELLTTLRVIAGPEAELFDVPSPRYYRVDTQSNRVGLRLEGPTWSTLAASDGESAPVVPGTVQVAGGLPLILGVACGTMGGYPVAGHVMSADLGRLAQLRPGDLVAFARVTLAEARAFDRLDRARCGSLRRRLVAAASDPGLAVERRD